jgi:MerR HTH family regulatory protein
MRGQFTATPSTPLLAEAAHLPARAGLISIREAARMLGCSVRTLRYRQAREEMPPRHRRGRSLFYRWADISRMARAIMK